MGATVFPLRAGRALFYSEAMRLPIFTVILTCLLFVTAPSWAQKQTIIRDAEIENILRGFADPVIRAADLDPKGVRLILVQSDDVNAFVAGGQNIFLYTGLLQKATDPGEVIGVIAHELGHIAGGHLVQRGDEMNRSSYEVMLGAIAGIGAAVATGSGQVGTAVLGGATHLTQRRLLSYSRAQESAADQAGLRYMQQAQINPTGLKTFMEKLADQELLPTSQQNEYIRTHPLSRDRVSTLGAAVADSPLRTKGLPEKWSEQFSRLQAKLMGFLQPQQVLWAYPDADKSYAADMARAIAAYRLNQVDEALRLVNALIAREPGNAYAHELQGQMLYDFGRSVQATAAYARAVERAPDEPLIALAFAQALVDQPKVSPTQLQEALASLVRIRVDDPRNTRVYRLLAVVTGRLGQDAVAQSWLAEEAFLQARYNESRRFADLALGQLPTDHPARQRLADLMLQLDQVKARKKD